MFRVFFCLFSFFFTLPLIAAIAFDYGREGRCKGFITPKKLPLRTLCALELSAEVRPHLRQKKEMSFHLSPHHQNTALFFKVPPPAEMVMGCNCRLARHLFPPPPTRGKEEGREKKSFVSDSSNCESTPCFIIAPRLLRQCQTDLSALSAELAGLPLWLLILKRSPSEHMSSN